MFLDAMAIIGIITMEEDAASPAGRLAGGRVRHTARRRRSSKRPPAGRASRTSRSPAQWLLSIAS
jgi:hypothetical protein